MIKKITNGKTFTGHSAFLSVTLVLILSHVPALGEESKRGTLSTASLAWDAVTKEYQAKLGDTNAIITYSVTNLTTSNVTIRSVRPSCGCTVATPAGRRHLNDAPATVIPF
jgi:hypothetical protein